MSKISIVQHLKAKIDQVGIDLTLKLFVLLGKDRLGTCQTNQANEHKDSDQGQRRRK
jgi:hypothetical protein